MYGSGKAKRCSSRLGNEAVKASNPTALAIRVGVVYSAASFRMTERVQIVPIILAAGSSRNLGMPKALAQFGNTNAISIAVNNCLGLDRPIVVLGCDAEQVRPAVSPGARVVVNELWQKGQLSSLLCAMESVPRSAAVLIYPVDHPLLQRRIVKQLVREFRRRKSSEEIVMPRFRQKFGHPIILSTDLRDELHRATTAREVVYRIPERIRVLEAGTSSIYEDFDTPDTYQKCLRRFTAHG